MTSPGVMNSQVAAYMLSRTEETHKKTKLSVVYTLRMELPIGLWLDKKHPWIIAPGPQVDCMMAVGEMIIRDICANKRRQPMVVYIHNAFLCVHALLMV